MPLRKYLWAIAAGLAATLPVIPSAMAQIPAELLQGGGGSEGSLYSDAFYKSKDGFWVLMRSRENNGLRCSVSYIMTDGLYAIHGPENAAQVKEGGGQIWFSGKNIPARDGIQQVSITINARGKTVTYPTALTKFIPEHGTFVLFLKVKNYLKTVIKKGEDTDEFTVQLDGKEVYAVKLVELQKAYRMLEKCMAAGSAKAD
ncbi:hypothetical protein [Lysobacter sp. CA199]|uniref:hypothetical protein n=1 Tax=Lysobacter sp. CA199 TaxID=3455608 RepID=UPI003F8D72C5